MPIKLPKVSGEAGSLFDRLSANDPRLTVRPMFGQPSAFVGGNLCFGAFGDEIVLRLSEADQARAAAVPGSHPFEPMPGRAMRGYYVLPPSAFHDAKSARDWIDRAVRHTGSLPPKKPKAR